MWSLGAFTYLLLTGEEAFKAENDQDLYKKILRGQYDQISANYQSISLNARVSDFPLCLFN
jgi:hypothetical protein